MTNVTVAIITFKRAALLKEALAQLADIAVPAGVAVDILIVDNDADRTAYDVMQEATAHSHFPIRYVLEERQGRGYARNKALDESRASDYLVFIDDDISVEKNWLCHLYQTAVRSQAQIVVGAVQYDFPEDAPSWAPDCRLFGASYTASGAVPYKVSTSNLWLDRQWLEKKGVRFPEQMFGEDTAFYVRALEEGAASVRCPEAIVHTKVPNERLTLDWVMRRTIRNGAVRADINKRRGTLSSLGQGLKMLLLAGGAAVLAAAGKRPWILCVEHAGMALGWMVGPTRKKYLIMTDA